MIEDSELSRNAVKEFNRSIEEPVYYLAAKYANGKPYIWGFHFSSLESAKRALLPATWIIDHDGNEIAHYQERN